MESMTIKSSSVDGIYSNFYTASTECTDYAISIQALKSHGNPSTSFGINVPCISSNKNKWLRLFHAKMISQIVLI
jgi:hypothetical protein